MDSQTGLELIAENREYSSKLAAALASGTGADSVKKQVVELLSALCVHSERGRHRVLDTLQHYKEIKGERHKLQVIVNELDKSSAADYRTALLAFINCLIISTKRLSDRLTLRNEFTEIGLLIVLDKLRNEMDPEMDFRMQLDVFEEQRKSDECQDHQETTIMDINSPLDLFYAILKQVAGTPQELPFLRILQHLSRVPGDSAGTWNNLERVIQRAVTFSDMGDDSTTARLQRSMSASRVLCGCQNRGEITARKSSVTGSSSSTPITSPTLSSVSLPLPPPPPPPPIAVTFPPPPPPPAASMAGSFNKREVTVKANIEDDSSSDLNLETVITKLPQQEIPTPKLKMKTINWNKIPSNKVLGKNNIWTQVAFSHRQVNDSDIDWTEMEDLFCQQTNSIIPSPNLGHRDVANSTGVLERRKLKENSEITLLDGKRSLNINIFLKQFRSSNEDIIKLIQHGEHNSIGAEKLKGLLKLLPEVDELDLLKSFTGNFKLLGNAEKFLVQLIQLPNYKLRIESMLLKEEFTSNMSYVEPSINSMIEAAQDLMTNKALQEVLYMILVSGNFLNAGGYAGEAAGVKLASLQKITDIRANKPNMTLIHFVALQAERRSKVLLTFVDKLYLLEEAAKTTVEQLHNEIVTLDSRLKKIKKQVELPNTESEIKHQMNDFLKEAEQHVFTLQMDMSKLEHVRQQLAEFFCEDVNSFKLEECFRIFHNFYAKFKQAVIDNERRRSLEEQANARRKQREELLAIKRQQLYNARDNEEQFLEMQIFEPRGSFHTKKGRKTNSEDEFHVNSSPRFFRKMIGSVGAQSSEENKEDKSPEMTPNGSLRRRKSKVLSEEDEGNLMEFLRGCGQDTSNRERRSWGSLDRSWARKARGSIRKRPGLLLGDFTNERERSSSPSPLGENNKPLTIRSEEETTSKANDDKTTVNEPMQTSQYKSLMSEERETIPKMSKRSEMDKSRWRKSNLNVANSSEEIRPNTSLDLCSLEPTLISNEKRSSSPLDHSLPDTLTIYIHSKSSTPIKSSDQSDSARKTTTDEAEKSSQNGTSDKIDIDQDNIETPPAVRKVISLTPVEKREPSQPNPCSRVLARNKENETENVPVGDGQFDRYSIARRTRRFKRNIDSDSKDSDQGVIISETIPKVEVSQYIESNNDNLRDDLNTRSLRLNKRSRNKTDISRDDLKKLLQSSCDDKNNGTIIKPILNNQNDVVKDDKNKNQEKKHDYVNLSSINSISYKVNRNQQNQKNSSSKENTALSTYKTNNENTPKKLPIMKLERFTLKNLEPSKKLANPLRFSSLRKKEPKAPSTPLEKSNSRNALNSSRSSLNSVANSINTNKKKALKTNNDNGFKHLVPRSANVKEVSVKKVPSLRKTSITNNYNNAVSKQTVVSFMKPTMSSFTKSSSSAINKPNVIVRHKLD